MIHFRNAEPDDLDQLRKLIPEGAIEPDWSAVVILERDGIITGFAQVKTVTRIEPLGASSGFDATLLFSYLEGALRNEEYEFYVLDSNKEFQTFVEKHAPVGEQPLGAGKWYIRKR